MTSRYYKLTDQNIIDAVVAHHKERDAAFDEAKDFAEKHGLGKPLFGSFNLFDARLHGFKPNGSQLELDGWFTQPRNGSVNPKARKGSPILNDYKKLVSSCRVDDTQLHKVLGWTPLDMFPTRPGLLLDISGEVKIIVFIVSEGVNALNGCEEITNIEYLELKNQKSDEVAA